MTATLLKQQFHYEIKFQDFNSNTHLVTIETDTSLDINSKQSIREALLDYIVDVNWDCENDFDGGRLYFLNKYGEREDFYIYIDAILDGALYKTITPLITWQTLEDHISDRDLVEILLTLCFKNFK